MTKDEKDAFWTAQIAKLRRASLLRGDVPQHQGYRQKLRHWRSGEITLNVGFDDQLEWVHVDITFNGPFRQSRFLRLHRQQEHLRAAIAKDLRIAPDDPEIEWVWDERADQGESWIILRRHGFNLSDKASREAAQDWVTQSVKAFTDHFGYFLDTM